MKKTTLLLSAALSFMSFSTMAQDNPTSLPPSLSGTCGFFEGAFSKDTLAEGYRSQAQDHHKRYY